MSLSYHWEFCPVCGSKDISEMFRVEAMEISDLEKEDYAVLRCGDCSTEFDIHTHPQFKACYTGHGVWVEYTRVPVGRVGVFMFSPTVIHPDYIHAAKASRVYNTLVAFVPFGVPFYKAIENWEEAKNVSAKGSSTQTKS